MVIWPEYSVFAPQYGTACCKSTFSLDEQTGLPLVIAASALPAGPHIRYIEAEIAIWQLEISFISPIQLRPSFCLKVAAIRRIIKNTETGQDNQDQIHQRIKLRNLILKISLGNKGDKGCHAEPERPGAKAILWNDRFFFYQLDFQFLTSSNLFMDHALPTRHHPSPHANLSIFVA